MMNSIYISLVTLWCLLSGISATDYCLPKLCPVGRPHIGCRNNRDFSSVCPQNETQMITITPELQQKILHGHNSKRQLIASGGLDGFEPAAEMVVMDWDDELAHLAELNVKTCKFGHDCHSTEKFNPSGQNLAKMWWRGGSYTDEEIILTRIDTWWLEYKNTNMSQMRAYPRSTNKMIGHFTVMTAGKNTHVGCAGIKFPENNYSSLTFACNYAGTNYLGLAMYKFGPAASKCLYGTSLKYPSLCLQGP